MVKQIIISDEQIAAVEHAIIELRSDISTNEDDEARNQLQKIVTKWRKAKPCTSFRKGGNK